MHPLIMTSLRAKIVESIASHTLQHKTLCALSKNEKEPQLDRMMALTKAVEVQEFCKALEQVLAELDKAIKELQVRRDEMKAEIDSTPFKAGYITSMNLTLELLRGKTP